MADKIIIRNTDSEAKLGGVQATDVLNGEMLLVREVDKERLYCKNSDGEISKIHRITNCGGFESEKDYVDLGLPSGLLWAKKNIGAATEEDAGWYFQWGDTVGYTAEQVGVDKEFAKDYSDYKWFDGDNITKYTGTGSTGDGLTTLEAIDDAATQIMGSDWRIPTKEELGELIENTDIYIVTINNEEVRATYSKNNLYRFEFSNLTESSKKGIKFYSKTNHSVYLFIPAGGFIGEININDDVKFMGNQNSLGIWSSSLSILEKESYSLTITGFQYRSGDVNRHFRRHGYNIRPVKSPQ